MKRLVFLLLLVGVAGPSADFAPRTSAPTQGGLYVRTVEAAAPPSIPSQGVAALTTFLRDATARGDVPGIVVAVVNRDGVLYREAFGKANVAKDVAMSKDTIFNIASMTKPVTSVAIMMLVEEGKLKLDDDVATYLPKYKNPVVITNFKETDATYDTRPATRPITIRHLLTHTSGIGYAFSSPTVAAIQQKTKLNELDMPLLFDPGEGWAYGASTRVLGHVVEAISGQKIDAFLASRILQPLGMHETAYSVPESKSARVVTVNSRTDGAFVERQTAAVPPPANPAGDGGLYSTAGDYGMFVRMLLNRGRLGSTRILSERTVRTMFQNHTGNVVVALQRSSNPAFSRDFPFGAGEDNWGLGFELAQPRVKKPATRAAGSGTWAGIFNTHFWVDPSKEIGVIVMMQVLPFYDEQAMKVVSGVEETIYRNLR